MASGVGPNRRRVHAELDGVVASAQIDVMCATRLRVTSLNAVPRQREIKPFHQTAEFHVRPTTDVQPPAPPLSLSARQRMNRALGVLLVVAAALHADICDFLRPRMLGLHPHGRPALWGEGWIIRSSRARMQCNGRMAEKAAKVAELRDVDQRARGFSGKLEGRPQGVPEGGNTCCINDYNSPRPALPIGHISIVARRARHRLARGGAVITSMASGVRRIGRAAGTSG